MAESRTSPLQQDQAKALELEISLLEKSYSALRQEILLQIGSIKNHIKNSQLLITGMISVVIFLLNTEAYHLKESTAYLWVSLMLLATTITYYLLYAIVESIYTMNALGEYLSSVESRMNKKLGQKIAIWESDVVPQLMGSIRPFKGVLQPLWMMNLYPPIVIFFVTVAAPFYVYFWKIWTWWYNWPDRAALLVCGLYSLISFVLAVQVIIGTYIRLRPEARQYIERAWEKPL
jgi:hypothetical protein